MPSENAYVLKDLRVLVVEDEALLAMCLAETIEEHGGIVAGSAGTLENALALVATAMFDVAILDLHLDGRTVEGVAQEIVNRGHRIVFSSGSNGSAIPQDFRKWPMLIKPYADDVLIAALKSAVPVSAAESVTH